MAEKLEQLFGRICKFSKDYSRFQTPLKIGSMTGRAGIANLQRFAELLQLALPANRLTNYRVDYSRGASYVPRVTWVAICPAAGRVSTGMSVTICFGREGEGAVAGLMVPAAAMVKGVPLCKRVGSTKLRVNVDGASKESSYNDRFVNPKEFMAGDFAIEALVSHIDASLALYESDYKNV